MKHKPTCACGSVEFEPHDMQLELQRREIIPDSAFVNGTPKLSCWAKTCKACGQITLWSAKPN